MKPRRHDRTAAVDEAYAALLARRVREKHSATWGLAETGATGPTGNRYGDPAGHTRLAVIGPAERTLMVRTGLSEREPNMDVFTVRALALLAETLGVPSKS